MDNASIGLLCAALGKVALITDPARFDALPKELLSFLEANIVAAKGKVYTDEFMLDIRRAILALHEEGCSKFMPSS
jgi:hypothetical protein